MRFSLLSCAGALVALLPLPLPAQNVLIAQGRARDFAHSLAPYIASTPEVVDVMLEMADIKPNEVVYDLGSGDGRILIEAAQRFRARAVGIEIEDGLVKKSEKRVESLGLQDRVRIIHADIRDVDLSPADVVTMYLMTDANASLRPKLEQSLRPGVRVVSHDYQVPGWKPNREEVAEGHSHRHTVYLYVMPPMKQ